jgi:muconolactone D-isomerase
VREFIVEITTTVPEGTDQAEVERRWAAEAVRIQELAADGHLARLWRAADGTHTIGLWSALSQAELEQKIIGTLPLRSWMAIRITPVNPHPNDPARFGVTE